MRQEGACSPIDGRTLMTTDYAKTSLAPPIWVLAMAVSAANVGISLLSPAIPQLRDDLMVTSDEAQLVLSAFLIMLGFGQLIAGSLSDRIGRRPVLVYGSLLFVLSGFGALLANSIEMLVFMRILQGLGAAACMAMGRVIISDSFQHAEAGRQMSTITMFQSVVPLLGFSFGGVLADLVGWRGSVGLMVVTAAIVFAGASMLLAESRDPSIKPVPATRIIFVYWQLLVTPLFIANAMMAATVTAVYFSMGGFLPYEFKRLGSSAFEFGLYFSAAPLGYMCGNSLSRNFGPRLGLDRAAFVGSALSVAAISILLALTLAGLATKLTISSLLFCYGVANGLIVANSLVGAIRAAGPHSGAATGLCGALQMACSAGLGSLVIWLGGDTDFHLGIGICWVMTAVGLACSLAALQRRAVP